jgi:hypothetical protein
MLVLQAPSCFEARVVEQLRLRKLTSAQYFGGAVTAQAWAEWSQHHPLSRPPAAPISGLLDEEFCAVDLGPGTGIPLSYTLAPHKTRVRRIIGVDASEAMLHLAQTNVRDQGLTPMEGVVADFLADSASLRRHLDTVDLPKLILCLGGTSGNFPLAFVWPTLRNLLGVSDYLLLGLWLCDFENREEILQAGATLYASEKNCQFSFSFFRVCGVTPELRHTFGRADEDHEEPGVGIVRGLYRFPETTTFRVGNETVEIERGGIFQWTESRRFLTHDVSARLKRYGLEVIRSEIVTQGLTSPHGLFLCRRCI